MPKLQDPKRNPILETLQGVDERLAQRANEAWWEAMSLLRGPIDPNSLGNWNPDVIRALLPAAQLVKEHYFRATVTGLENIPAGPSILAGIHGGGVMTPDTSVMYLSFYEHFQVSRPLYAMAHRLLFYVPGFNALIASIGGIEGTRANAMKVLEAGHPFLVFPGGEEDMARPWTRRNTVNFAGRTGFVRMALDAGVPILPVGSVGGHEGYFVLTDGKKLAASLGLKRLFHLNTFPLALSAPWGLTLGYLPYIPLPAKIGVAFGEPMYFSPSAREKEDPHYHAWVRDEVEKAVQLLVDRLAQNRRVV